MQSSEWKQIFVYICNGTFENNPDRPILNFHSWNQSLLMPLLKLNRIRLCSLLSRAISRSLKSSPQDRSKKSYLDSFTCLIVSVLSSMSCLATLRWRVIQLLPLKTQHELLNAAVFVQHFDNQFKVSNSKTDNFHRGVVVFVCSLDQLSWILKTGLKKGFIYAQIDSTIFVIFFGMSTSF